MTKEALKQLREVHATQGRDGCWDIDDYMLGLYNGLELALSIVENRACKYKQRPKSQPEQEPVADVLIDHEDEDGHVVIWLRDYALENGRHLLYTAPPQRKPLTDEEIAEVAERMEATDAASSFWREFARAIEAAHNIKDKNND